MIRLKEILERIKIETGYAQKRIASDIFGISTENLSNKIRRNSIDINVLVSWAKGQGVDLNWLLTGEGEPHQPSVAKEAQIPPECLPNHSEISDAEIVDQFSDKKYARVLNFHLVELERLNSEAFKKVDPYIKGMLDGLRMKPTQCCMYKGPDRRTAERRVKDSPGKFKGAKDRRSGKDRRIAANG